MKRLFTFGCSFTQYWRWPTWADYVAHQWPFYENWGLCGAGNSYIFYSLMECHQRHSIGPDDTVLIMWTNTSREDRYVRDRWLEGGNVYWGTVLGDRYVREFACERGYLIRDLALIAATKELLEKWRCQWRWFCMAPFDQTNSDNGLGESPGRITTQDDDVRDLYHTLFQHIQPSVLTTVFNGSWFSGQGIADANDPTRRDFHPTPVEHVRYIDLVASDLANDQGRLWMQDCENLARGNLLRWNQPNRPQGRL